MIDSFIGFISEIIGNDKLTTMLISLFPLIELKGGILFARQVGLGFFTSFFYAYIGSTMVFFVIFFLLKPILNLMKRWKFFNKIATKFESYFQDKAQKSVESELQNEQLNNNKNNGHSSKIKMLAVFLFVAFPLPLTGVYTGTAVAVFLNLSFKESLLVVTVGNFIAGLIISLIAHLFFAYIDIILFAFLCLVVVSLIIIIFKLVKKKKV